MEIAGDTAHEVGEAILTLESGAFTGKYVVVWKKIGGQWRLHRDIWNAKGA
jgi:ketosteroid isomerase-like protein